MRLPLPVHQIHLEEQLAPKVTAAVPHVNAMNLVVLFAPKEPKMTTINSMTIADLMGVDHDVWLKKIPNSCNYELSIESDETQIEEAVHEYAIDSMADFCTRFLASYHKINKEN